MERKNRPEIEQLAAALASTVKGVRPAKARLRVIEAPKPTLFDSITRECCIRRVRFLARSYQLAWLLEQETFDTAGIDTIDDEKLANVLRTMEHARECIAADIPFEDAGLVRNTADALPCP